MRNLFTHMGRTKGAKNRDQSNVSKLRFAHSVYRLVIRNIEGYGTFLGPIQGQKRQVNLCPQLDLLKQRVLEHLIQKESKRKAKLLNWSIAWQTHAASGLPHLDILVVYQKNVNLVKSSYDYLLKDLQIQQRDVGDDVGVGHVWITPYSSKKLSKAILDYGQKEDPGPLSNISLEIKEDLTRLHRLKADPYRYLELQMRKDPTRFNLQQYCQKYDLFQHISNWSSIKSKLRDSQFAAANLALKSRPGFKFIDRALIQSKLSPSELQIYDSWGGYRTIVDYLNQIPIEGNKRPMKTMNLLISGPASIGKTSLFHNPNHKSDKICIEDFCAVYQMGMSTWFPQYRSGVYHMILWNQAKLTAYSYDTILKLLEGSYVDLPIKGGIAPKRDNPLVVMTSNMTLEQMIKLKFNYSSDLQQMARANLAVRVQNIVVPKGYDLFLLQKLIVQS